MLSVTSDQQPIAQNFLNRAILLNIILIGITVLLLTLGISLVWCFILFSLAMFFTLFFVILKSYYIGNNTSTLINAYVENNLSVIEQNEKYKCLPSNVQQYIDNMNISSAFNAIQSYLQSQFFPSISNSIQSIIYKIILKYGIYNISEVNNLSNTGGQQWFVYDQIEFWQNKNLSLTPDSFTIPILNAAQILDLNSMNSYIDSVLQTFLQFYLNKILLNLNVSSQINLGNLFSLKSSIINSLNPLSLIKNNASYVLLQNSSSTGANFFYEFLYYEILLQLLSINIQPMIIQSLDLAIYSTFSVEQQLLQLFSLYSLPNLSSIPFNTSVTNQMELINSIWDYENAFISSITTMINNLQSQINLPTLQPPSSTSTDNYCNQLNGLIATYLLSANSSLGSFLNTIYISQQIALSISTTLENNLSTLEQSILLLPTLEQNNNQLNYSTNSIIQLINYFTSPFAKDNSNLLLSNSSADLFSLNAIYINSMLGSSCLYPLLFNNVLQISTSNTSNTNLQEFLFQQMESSCLFSQTVQNIFFGIFVSNNEIIIYSFDTKLSQLQSILYIQPNYIYENGAIYSTYDPYDLQRTIGSQSTIVPKPIIWNGSFFINSNSTLFPQFSIASVKYFQFGCSQPISNLNLLTNMNMNFSNIDTFNDLIIVELTNNRRFIVLVTSNNYSSPYIYTSFWSWNNTWQLLWSQSISS